LRNEAAVLLDQSLRLLPVTDDSEVRENFANFDERWLSLSSSVTQTEQSNYQGDEPLPDSAKERLESAQEELQVIKQTLESMNITVESEDELYTYLEKLQVNYIKNANFFDNEVRFYHS